MRVARVARVAARGSSRLPGETTPVREKALEKLAFEKLEATFEKLKKSKDTLAENVKLVLQVIQQKSDDMVKVRQEIDKFRSYLDKSVRKQ